MARYEIWLLTSAGRIDHVVPLYADCDQDAVRAVLDETHPHWKELRIGSRLIGRYGPNGLGGDAKISHCGTVD